MQRPVGTELHDREDFIRSAGFRSRDQYAADDAGAGATSEQARRSVTASGRARLAGRSAQRCIFVNLTQQIKDLLG
jgi:hypothetical protein